MSSLLVGAWSGTVILGLMALGRLIHRSPLKTAVKKRVRAVLTERNGPLLD